MPNAQARLFAAGTLVGLGRSVQILQDQLEAEVTRVILETPFYKLRDELARVLGSDALAEARLASLRGLRLDEIVEKYPRRRAATLVKAPASRATKTKATKTSRARVLKNEPHTTTPVQMAPVSSSFNIVQDGEHFVVTLPDGQVRRSKRRRDLVRRIREAGIQAS